MQRARDTIAARVLRAFAVAALALCAAIVMTWPLAAGMDRFGRTTSGDGQYAIWNVAWVAHALTTAPLDLFDANIFFPHRLTLAYSEANIVAGIVGIPAWWLTENAYAAHNSAVLFAFATSLLGMWALARYLSGSGAAAAVAAITFAFAPYFFAHTAHIQLLMAGGVPLSLLMLHRVADAPSIGGGVRLGVSLAVQALACAYYGIFAGLAVGYAAVFLAITRGGWRHREYWIAIGTGAVVSILCVLPFFVPYIRMRQETGFERPLADSVRFAANLPSYLASSAHAHEWLLPHAAALGRWTEVLFPGFAALALGGAGVIIALRSRASAGDRDGSTHRETAALYALLGLLALWASFGPAAGLYTVLYRVIPLFSFLRAPARMGVIISLVLAVFAAIAVATLLRAVRTSRRVAAAAALGALVLLELNRVPFPWERAPAHREAYTYLARLPRAPLVEFPFYGDRAIYHLHAQYMLFSTAHWQPMINGYSDHIPQDFRDAAPVLAGFPSRESFTVLRRRRVRYLTIHWDMYGPRRSEIEQRLREYLGYLRPLSADRKMTLYEVIGFP